jgi:hypothetical protein
MNNQEFKQWQALYKQYKNGYHLSDHDWRELTRLNHLLMEITHEIHNKNMLGR